MKSGGGAGTGDGGGRTRRFDPTGTVVHSRAAGEKTGVPWHDATLDGEMGEGYNGVNGGMNYGQETDSTTDTSKGRFNTPSTPGDASAADGRGRRGAPLVGILDDGDAG
ncbi:MAG: hypothetical protein RSC43_07655, partial [Clostridia bacterium]